MMYQQESNLQWKSRKETLLSDADEYDMDDDDDDPKSISSESSGDGGGIPLNLPISQSETNCLANDQQNGDEITTILKELHSSNQVMAILNSGDFTGEMDLYAHLNVYKLIMLFMCI